MDLCSRNPNRTAPVGEDGPRADVPLCSRTNGWSWPPHPFQLLAWLLYVYFAVTGLGVFVPLLPAHWIPAGYICQCTGIAFAGHLCVHIMAVSVDPADLNIITRSHKGPVPVFDRSKHAHVIENCHCYLCQVDVGPKSKHCSACNKCVANFDHHCRWLNNCVGSRNYKLFLHSVVSALLGVGLVLIVTSYVFVEFFLDPSKLRTDNHFLVRNDTGVWYVFLPVAPVRAAAAVIPVVGAVTISLSLLTFVLLSHLLCFHIYLMWNRLSTYEYIVRQRHRQDSRKPDALKGTTAPSVDFIKDVDYPVTLGFTNPQMDIEEPATAAAPEEAEFLANGRVRCASSSVMEEDVPPTIPTELNNAEHTHRHSQKKRKTVRKVLADVSRESRCSSGSQHQSLAPTPVDPMAQRLSFPPFPHRASLPPLAAVTGNVLAAAPPAEYHSDSAESLDEIPVALARLGSSSSAAGGDTSLSSHRSASEIPRPSPRPRTKRKAASSHCSKGIGALRFEMVSSQQPTVFVSWASGDTARGPGFGHSLESVPRTGLGSGPRATSPLVSWTNR